MRKRKKKERGKLHFVQKFKLKLTPSEMQTIHISYFILICDAILTISWSQHQEKEGSAFFLYQGITESDFPLSTLIYFRFLLKF